MIRARYTAPEEISHKLLISKTIITSPHACSLYYTGVYMSVAVTVGIIFWTFSYVFRVANKDMTYVKQLKEYEDAVLRKRLEELEVLMDLLTEVPLFLI
jgi:hypothetical protein